MRTISYPYYLAIISILSQIRPLALAYRLAASLTCRFSPREEEMTQVIQRFAQCAPAINEDNTETWAQSYRENVGVATLNTYLFRKMSPDWIGQRIVVTGEEHLRTALSAGRGVLVLTAHQHHLVFLAITLGLLGLKISPVLMDPSLTVPDHLIKYMKRMIEDSERHFNGGRYILVDFQNRSVRQFYRVLAAGEVALSANDFPNDLAPKRRISLPFLNQSLSIPFGSIKIAVEQGALITSAFMHWHDRDRFSVEFSPIDATSVDDICDIYAKRLQQTVIKDPGGWEGWKWSALFNTDSEHK